MQKKKHPILNLTIFLCTLLVLSLGPPAFGAIFWKGKFKVISADPWKIEIIESFHGTSTNVIEPRLSRSPKTGLPFVTEDHWQCAGREITESDVGQIYEFIGNIPDIGGSYDFYSLPQSIDNSHAEASSEYYTAEYRTKALTFNSKWSQTDPFTIKLIGVLLALLAIIILGNWMRSYLDKTR
ncbi:MAG: hypothetical protein GY869_11415 [Planctomycetes bacterium]|nr:hypothetical protein [Planctomycetota bacterium]